MSLRNIGYYEETHSVVTPQKTAFFIVTAVKTPKLFVIYFIVLTTGIISFNRCVIMANVLLTDDFLQSERHQNNRGQ
jgi:hypothetical protein